MHGRWLCLYVCEEDDCVERRMVVPEGESSFLVAKSRLGFALRDKW
jgi:hypothetical protein